MFHHKNLVSISSQNSSTIESCEFNIDKAMLKHSSISFSMTKFPPSTLLSPKSKSPSSSPSSIISPFSSSTSFEQFTNSNSKMVIHEAQTLIKPNPGLPDSPILNQSNINVMEHAVVEQSIHSQSLQQNSSSIDNFLNQQQHLQNIHSNLSMNQENIHNFHSSKNLVNNTDVQDNSTSTSNELIEQSIRNRNSQMIASSSTLPQHQSNFFSLCTTTGGIANNNQSGRILSEAGLSTNDMETSSTIPTALMMTPPPFSQEIPPHNSINHSSHPAATNLMPSSDCMNGAMMNHSNPLNPSSHHNWYSPSYQSNQQYQSSSNVHHAAAIAAAAAVAARHNQSHSNSNFHLQHQINANGMAVSHSQPYGDILEQSDWSSPISNGSFTSPAPNSSLPSYQIPFQGYTNPITSVYPGSHHHSYHRNKLDFYNNHFSNYYNYSNVLLNSAATVAQLPTQQQQHTSVGGSGSASGQNMLPFGHSSNHFDYYFNNQQQSEVPGLGMNRSTNQSIVDNEERQSIYTTNNSNDNGKSLSAAETDVYTSLIAGSVDRKKSQPSSETKNYEFNSSINQTVTSSNITEVNENLEVDNKTNADNNNNNNNNNNNSHVRSFSKNESNNEISANQRNVKRNPINNSTIRNGSQLSSNRKLFNWMNKSTSNSSSSSVGKTRTKDKYRVVYSENQRFELEKEFQFSRYITIRRKSELARQLLLSERQVKIWFQNRRAKDRKQNRKKEEMIKKIDCIKDNHLEQSSFNDDVGPIVDGGNFSIRSNINIDAYFNHHHHHHHHYHHLQHQSLLNQQQNQQSIPSIEFISIVDGDGLSSSQNSHLYPESNQVHHLQHDHQNHSHHHHQQQQQQQEFIRENRIIVNDGGNIENDLLEDYGEQFRKISETIATPSLFSSTPTSSETIKQLVKSTNNAENDDEKNNIKNEKTLGKTSTIIDPDSMMLAAAHQRNQSSLHPLMKTIFESVDLGSNQSDSVVNRDDENPLKSKSSGQISTSIDMDLKHSKIIVNSNSSSSPSSLSSSSSSLSSSSIKLEKFLKNTVTTAKVQHLSPSTSFTRKNCNQIDEITSNKAFSTVPLDDTSPDLNPTGLISFSDVEINE